MSRADHREPHGVLPSLVLSGVVVLVVLGLTRGVHLANLHNGLLALACSAVGSYVLWQRPRHRVGVLLVATGVVEAVLFAGRQYGLHPTAGGDSWLAWLGVWPLAIALALMTLSVLCFPDGRLPSPGWRWVARAVVAVAGVCAALSAVWPVEYEAAGVVTAHPLHATAPAAVADLWSAIAHPAYAAFQLLWVVAVVVRWRRVGASGRIELGWLIVAAGCSGVALIAGLAVAGSPRAGVLAAVLVPVAAGVAIVHGQHLASYSALTWLSRAAPGAPDLPTDLARAAADAVRAPAAMLWMGSPERLHVVGVWPPGEAVIPATTLAALTADDAHVLRLVGPESGPSGALTVARAGGEGLSRAESRLLDDLAAQAGLLLEHLDLSGVIADRRAAGALEELTGREREVLELMARGLSNAAIGEELHLSIKTVEPLVSGIFAKLELAPGSGSNRRVLAVLAYLRA